MPTARRILERRSVPPRHRAMSRPRPASTSVPTIRTMSRQPSRRPPRPTSSSSRWGDERGWFGVRVTEGEGTDAAKVELPKHQVDLVRAVAATGTPLVGVFFQGRPLAIAEVDELLAASLVAYYPGPHGAQAIASVLFGDINPGGRLPYTIPRATGQVPLYYSQKRGSGYRRSEGDMFRSYIDLENSPLYPFGHGLSYTSFEYSDVTLDAQEVPADGGAVTISVDVLECGRACGLRGRTVLRVAESRRAHPPCAAARRLRAHHSPTG
ncbi:glycoside hydrolase family 3 C-terminal domain-containing protein [Streptomyces sp. GTA36]